MQAKPGMFDLNRLSRSITEQREARDLTWTELTAVTGVAASTIQRFETAADAEADGVLALVEWLERTPEDFIEDSSVPGVLLAPAVDGQIRVDMSLVTKLPASTHRSKTSTRTTIQRLTADAQANRTPIAALTRWSPI